MATRKRECEPVGPQEIADKLGVSRGTVYQWQFRAETVEFPEPRWTVGGRPAWDWLDVEEWAVATGRLEP